MTTSFEDEIDGQPGAMTRLLGARGAVEAVAARIRAFEPRFVLLAARGSSDNAARYAQYLLGVRAGLAVALATPSLFTRYGGRPRLDGALVIGISQSGASPDVVAVMDEARRQGAFTLAITNEPGSALERAAGAHLPLLAGEERSVSASKTYTAELLALAMLATALGGDDAAWRELERVPQQVAGTLRLNPRDPARVAGLVQVRRFLVLGRGFNYATAFELALKLKETSYVIAEPYSPPDLLHGPIAMLEPGFPVVFIAASGALDAEHGEVLAELERRHACPIVISDRPDLIARGMPGLAIAPGVPEWLSPLTAVAAGQRFALELALARGHDPDHPRGLTKITLTT